MCAVKGGKEEYSTLVEWSLVWYVNPLLNFLLVRVLYQTVRHSGNIPVMAVVVVVVVVVIVVVVVAAAV